MHILFGSGGVVSERVSSSRRVLWSLSYYAKGILFKPLGFKFFESLRQTLHKGGGFAGAAWSDAEEALGGAPVCCGVGRDGSPHYADYL